MPVACPEGKEKLLSVVTGSGQTGRLRWKTPFNSQVVRLASSMTATVQIPARTCLRTPSSTAVRSV